jgi:hypothetical protein
VTKGRGAIGEGAPRTRSPRLAGHETRRSAPRIYLLGLALSGVFALSALGDGLYSRSAWLPVALVTLAGLGAVVLLAPGPLGGPALGAAGALGFLAVWSALSAGWADAPDSAWLEANRWLLYCAALVVLAASLRTAADRRAAVVIVVAGATLLALYVEFRLLAGTASGMFFGYRLNDPLGYVNGEATVLLLGFWPLTVFAAHRDRPDAAGALAVGGAGLLLGLAVLTQSRSGLVAFAVSAIVCLAFAPRRLRLLGALLATGAGVAAASPALLAVYHGFRPEVIGHPAAGVLRDAGLAAAGGALVAAAAWFAGATAYRRLGARNPVTARRIVVLAIAATVVCGAVVVAPSAGSKADRAYDDFRSLSFDKGGTDRFTQGGGGRHDLWRIAADQARDHPVRGVGAGNYTSTYFRERRQPSDVRQAHSLEMQALGELGIPGALAVLGFAACVFAGAARARRRVGIDGVVAVAALGMFSAWFAQTSVDWIHNLPGVTGMALVAAAVLVAPQRAESSSDRRRPLRAVLAAVALAAIALAGVSVARQYLSDHYRDQARSELGSSPHRALDDVRRSMDLGAAPIADYYIAAAAYARLGSYADAKAALRDAAAREPANPVPPLLLGDLELRRESGRRALAAYRRAQRLSPLDAALPPRIADARELAEAKR